MSKLLTQEEIDALLSQESAGDKSQPGSNPEKEVRLYDFRRPERVNKEQIKVLRNIHENFARLLSTYLSNTLRTMIDVKSPVIDQVSYLEFTMSAADFTNMFIFEIDQLDGQALLDIDPDFTFFIIDRLFGGTGRNISRRSESITTIIENSVLRNIADRILVHFQEAWEQVDHLNCHINNFETNPQLVTIAPSSETMLVLNFPVIAKNFEFTILLCFPYFMVEPVLKKLLSQNYMTLLKKKSTEEDAKSIQHIIEQTKVTLEVEIGNIDITVEEFVELREGMILKLDKRVDDYLTGIVSGTGKFLGVPGRHRNKTAFKIEYLTNDEGEIIHE
ncbi:MAG: flagellar motor switch protein FliM [Candidatus Cloacimonadota bacterium]|nr:MAG: flagellar motor switch protein FliM [Candidatus Cloacimonadota bacterium]